MTEYRVSWEVDIEAESPLQAAQKAQAMQRDPHSIATFFSVAVPCSCGCGKYYERDKHDVDLDDADAVMGRN